MAHVVSYVIPNWASFKHMNPATRVLGGTQGNNATYGAVFLSNIAGRVVVKDCQFQKNNATVVRTHPARHEVERTSMQLHH